MPPEREGRIIVCLAVLGVRITLALVAAIIGVKVAVVSGIVIMASGRGCDVRPWRTTVLRCRHDVVSVQVECLLNSANLLQC